MTTLIRKRNKPYCFIIWGISDSGKDTVYKLLSKHITLQNIKWSQPAKDLLAKWLQIPEDAFNNKEYRAKLVLNTVTGELEDYTYDDVIVNSFEAWNKIIPGGWLTVGYVADRLVNPYYPYLGNDIAITDTRRLIEVYTIKSLLAQHYHLVLLHVVGRGVQKNSDRELTIGDFRFIEDRFSILNPPELDEVGLESKVKVILETLCLTNSKKY